MRSIRLVLFCLLTVIANARAVEVVILHDNDNESHMIDDSPDRVAKFITLYDQLKAEAAGTGATTLLINGGDSFLPSPQLEASLNSGPVGNRTFFDARALNRVGYDVINIGNHEFDLGPALLAEFIGNAAWTAGAPPYISSNLSFVGEPSLQALVTSGRIAEGRVITRNGETFGLIGLTTPWIPEISSPGNVQVLTLPYGNPNPTPAQHDALASHVQGKVNALIAANPGLNKIILVSHLQNVRNEIELSKRLRNVDLIIAAGGHELAANSTAAGLVRSEDVNTTPIVTYPVTQSDLDGKPVHILTTKGEYRYVGFFKCTFNTSGDVTAIDTTRTRPRPVVPALVSDPTIVTTVVTPLNAYIASLANNIIAVSQVPLEGRRSSGGIGVRVTETNQGNLLADALLWEGGRIAASVPGTPVPQVGLQNGGGMRKDALIPAGNFTELNTNEICAFSNFVAVVPDIPHTQFKEILEHSVSNAPASFGGFGQLAGCRIVVDLTRQAQSVNTAGAVLVPGERVRQVVLSNGTVVVENGVVLTPAAFVCIATNDFTAEGGDNYPFRNAPFVSGQATYQKALFNYVRESSTFAGLTALNGQITAARYPFPNEGRIQLVSGVPGKNVAAGGSIEAGSLQFIGEAQIPQTETLPVGLNNNPIGGLSGIVYNSATDRYLAISDDPSQLSPARFYTLQIALGSNNLLNNGEVVFQGVTSLGNPAGAPFASLTIDPEAIALLPGTTPTSIFVASEGFNNSGSPTQPFVNQFNISSGRQGSQLSVPSKFTATGTGGMTGIRHNLAFEALSISPSGASLFVGTEGALLQDGPAAAFGTTSTSRIIRYSLLTGLPNGEFVYLNDAVVNEPVPPSAFAVNGLVELLALDDNTLLALERSFSVGVAGNSCRLYRISLNGATDVSAVSPLTGMETPVTKTLLFNFDSLVSGGQVSFIDNLEGMTFGPDLPDGRKLLIVCSDNNFTTGQFSQFLAFAVTPSTVLLNEISAAPPEDEQKYFELKGAPGLNLDGVRLVALAGDAGDFGEVVTSIDLTGSVLGSNGLLIGADNAIYTDVPSATTFLNLNLEDEFDADSISFLLLRTTAAVNTGDDFDANNDGTLDSLPADAVILDSFGYRDGTLSDKVYGGVEIKTVDGDESSAATRIPGDSRRNAAAWYNGDVLTQFRYDPTDSSANLPTGAYLTPGRENVIDVIVTYPFFVEEGGSNGIVSISLTRVPDNSIDITVTADSQSEVSSDGVTFANSAVLTFTDTTAQTLFVRAINDSAVEDDEDHLTEVSFDISEGDGATYPAGLPVPAIVLGVNDNDFPAGVVTVLPSHETAPTVKIPPDADDPAFWVHPTTPTMSLVICTQKQGGFSVYDLNGATLLDEQPANARLNNVDVLYNFPLATGPGDIAVFTDRISDKLAVYRIQPTAPFLVNITDTSAPALFAGSSGADFNASAYGLATYRSPSTGKFYAFASQNNNAVVKQLELTTNGNLVRWSTVRTITLETDDEDKQVEGMVVDTQLRTLYVGQEEVGIFKLDAEPTSATATVSLANAVALLGADGLTEDVEGLTIYYNGNGTGFLLASSQGSNTFNVYTREGANTFVGRFRVGSNGGIDATQESDGADVINIPLGANFPQGLLVVQDGRNADAAGQIDGTTNFKFVPWQNVQAALNLTMPDTTGYNPRKPVTDIREIQGTTHVSPLAETQVRSVYGVVTAVRNAGDCNGDGIRDGSQDEFIELVNTGGAALDISGWTLNDGAGLKHTFPAGSILPAGGALVVFGAGTPAPIPGVVVQTASSGSLGLNNASDSGDTITIRDTTSAVMATMQYFGSVANDDQSINRDTDLTGSSFVRHKEASGADARRFTPGRRTDGTPFSAAGSGAGNLVINEVMADPGTGGFYVQCPGDDGNPLSSEGILVFTNQISAPVFSTTAVPTAQRARTSNIVTLTTPVVHGFSAGQLVNVSGLSGTAFNGTFLIIDTPTPTTFRYRSNGANQAMVADVNGAVLVVQSNLQPGDLVLINGRATEFGFSDNLKITELDSITGVFRLRAGDSLPAPVVIGAGGRVPPTQTISSLTGKIDTSSRTLNLAEGTDFYEALEGMRVRVNNAVATGPTTDFGETYVLADGGAGATGLNLRGGITILQPNADRPRGDYHPERVQVDANLVALVSANTKDNLGTVTGVLDYNFGTFELIATDPITLTSGGLQPEVTSLVGTPDQLTVATFNVENLSFVNPQAKFDELADRIVNNLKSPDILALEEIQDDDGPTDLGPNTTVVTAVQTLNKLTAAITAKGGPTYQFRQIDPVDDQEGGQPGGNIRVGYLFNPARVSFTDRAGGTSTSAVTVSAVSGKPQLNFNPGRIAPGNPAFASTRLSLAAEFEFNGRRLFLVNNHFSSKGGDKPLYGDIQPPALSSEAARIQQAAVVADFVEQILVIDPEAAVIVLGDLNDFQFSPPLAELKAVGLQTLVERLPEVERYTYNFQGNAQTLDHIMISPSLDPITDYDSVHINSEFAVQVSDHDPSVARITLPRVGRQGLRVATFNCSLNRTVANQMKNDLMVPPGPNLVTAPARETDQAKRIQQIRNVCEIIQRVNPDIVLLNEFDYDPASVALLKQNFLEVSQNGAATAVYPFHFIAESNTGIPTGFDLNNNGTAVTTVGAAGYGDDCFGFGAFPGQFGMLLLSKYPILTSEVRTFQKFLWKDMPGALLPDDPSTPGIFGDFYSPAELQIFRLSSKSHWDVPVVVNGAVIHALCSHPTPPVFDGPEDRNGTRNFDEIRFWKDYISGFSYMYDDKGVSGGLQAGAHFVILGDQNSDPRDGDSIIGATDQLLRHPYVNTSLTPFSDGGTQQAALQGGANSSHLSDPKFDTADFADTTPGNLRADYVLPSKTLTMTDARVFWPANNDALFPLVGLFDPNLPVNQYPSSDHRLVWVDLTVATSNIAQTMPNGVSSGDVTANSAVLWTRSTLVGNVIFSLSKEPGVTNSTSQTVAVSAADVAGLKPAKTEFTGLTADTVYYYRASNGTDSLTGTFRTAAAPGSTTGLRFGVSGDWRGELAPYPAIQNATSQPGNTPLNFFVKLGDTVYADIASPASQNFTDPDQAQTLEEFRAKHAEVYGERAGLNAFGRLQSQTAILATIDDHEVTNDFAGGAAANTDPEGRFGNSTNLINTTPLYTNGLQAFQEYNAIRDETYSGGLRKLYRNNRYGNDAAVMLLDNRSFRDAELPAADLANPASVAGFLSASLTQNRTMLGAQQIADLKADLLAAQSGGVTWKFVMVAEPIQNLGPVGAGDRFEGYAKERTEILKFINDNNINNVVFVAADIHGTVVNNLTYQTAFPGAQIPTGAFEITTGAVAFDAPFGPTVVNLAAGLGLITPQDAATYNALPRAVKEVFVQNLLNTQLNQFGYDPVGLENSPIDATLTAGAYTATSTYGWTEFKIDPVTQELTVTTYGIDAYTVAQAAANPAGLLQSMPEVVSQFVVRPAKSVDLAVTKTNGVTSVAASAQTAYTITVTNNGPDDAKGVRVQDTLPAALLNATWSRVGDAGARTGTGNIDDTIDLASGLSATYTLTATVSGNATGTLTNTALVTVPLGYNDGVVANNTAADSDTVTNPAPVTENGVLTVNEDAVGTGTLKGSDTNGNTLTFSLVALPTKGTVDLTNPTTGAYTYTPAAGATGGDSFTFKANDGTSDSNVSTLTITILAFNDAPIAAIGGSSPLTGTAGVAVALSSLGSSDPDGSIASYAWFFGDGSTGSGASPSYTWAAAGTYTITLIVTDNVGAVGAPVSKQIVIGPGGPASPPDQELVLAKALIKLDFAKSGKDMIMLQGELPVPAGFSVAGKPLQVNIGGVLKTFTLDGKGRARTADDSFQLSIKSTRGEVGAQDAKCLLKLIKGDFSDALADEKLDGSADVRDADRTVKVTFTFNGVNYTNNLILKYDAKQGKTGSAKK